jgi:hypothetical protein
MRNQSNLLPGSPEARRALLADLFERNPQMERLLLKAPRREFTALSDGDVERFLKQLHELGADEPSAEGLVDQQPETD